MANISTEYYSRFAVGPNVTPILLLQPQLHDMQPSLLKQEAINSNHLYQTTLSSDDPIEYSFAFSSAPSAIDMTSVCSTNPSRFMLDLDQNIHMLSQSQVQSSNNSMPDFDLFPNLVQSVSSSSPFQFDPSIQPNAFPTYSRVHDDGSFETMKLPLDATTPSLSSSSDTSSPSVSSSASSSPVPNDYEEAMATVIPVIACANCKRSHIKCDSGRPCQNCLKHPNKALTCRDAIPKPRGRPKGGSKAAAEAILQARLKQQQQQQQQQLRDQYQGHISRPRVMSLTQQHKHHLPMLELQQHHPYRRQQPHRFYSRSSPTSPAASEHRAIRYRRPSLPAWHHHSYAMSSPASSPSMSFPPPSTLASDMLYPLTAPCVLPSAHQRVDAHHVLQERLPMVGIHPHSGYPATLSMGPCPQQIQQELHRLQMMTQSSCGQSPVSVKSEPKEMGPVGDHDADMLLLLRQKYEAEAELQRIQQLQKELQEQYENQQVLYSLKKQQQQKQHYC